MSKLEKAPSFAIISYYLDGYYHHSEAIRAKTFPKIGNIVLIFAKNGHKTEAKIVEIEEVSLDEYRVLLCS